MAFNKASDFTIQQAAVTDINAQINITYSSERKKSLSPIGIIPPSTSSNFTGQNEYLEMMHKHFDINDYSGQKMFLLYGMGGIGKTQICLKFKDNVTDNYFYIFWIDATSSDTIEQSMKDIYKTYSLKMPQGMSYSTAMVLQWISNVKDKWMMIYDNADGPADIVNGFLPAGNKGHILISSRNPEHKRIVSPSNSVEVNVMHKNTAIDLLLKASGLHNEAEKYFEPASEICSKLYFLPLAIDQAGAYINAGRCSIEKYISIYEKYSSQLMDNKSFKGASKYDKTVYGTWEVSIKKIQEMASDKDNEDIAMAAQYAIKLMYMCAFMHHENISDEIFERAAKHYHEKLDEWKDDTLPTFIPTMDTSILNFDQYTGWKEMQYQESIGILISFSLIKRTVDGAKFGLHPLVQKWCQDRLKLRKRNLWIHNARCMLLISTTKEDTTVEYMYLSALLLHITQNLSFDHIKTMTYYDDLFQLLHNVLSKNGKLLHMGNVANTYIKLGRYAEAERLQKQILELSDKILGPEHPETLTSMENLGIRYGYLGRYADAQKLQEQVLKMRKQILGTEYPETIISMANLAITYRKLGKCNEAQRLEEQVLEMRCRILGPEHPDTLLSMGNLAVTYTELGKYAKAERLQEQVLDMRSRTLGPEHPDTLVVMANLGSTYRELGKYTEAEKLEEQVLEMGARNLGTEHPHILQSMANLAVTYGHLGKFADAERLEEQVLEMRGRVLGPEHPNTITSMAHLAVTYCDLGKYGEAERLEVQVLEMRGRILGPEHPDVFKSMENLANTYRALGKFSEAEELEGQLINRSVNQS